MSNIPTPKTKSKAKTASKIPTSGRDSGTHSRSSSVSNLTAASDIHSGAFLIKIVFIILKLFFYILVICVEFNIDDVYMVDFTLSETWKEKKNEEVVIRIWSHLGN